MSIFFLNATAVTAAMAALLPTFALSAPLSLEDALTLATQRSASARSASAGADSAAESARSAGQLPDPTLRVGIENLPATGPDRAHTTRDSMTMKRLGISQEWLSPRKRALRQAAAEAGVARELVSVEISRTETRLQTALAYIDAAFAAEALRLTRRTEMHALEEWEASNARLASSTGSSAEALALSAARGEAADETAEVLQQQNTAQVALQRWVGVPVDELLPLPSPDLPTEAAYVRSHPSVTAMRQDIEVARQIASMTAGNREANWTWELAYGQRTGFSDMVSVGVSIPLQVAPASRQDRETQAKLALVTKAEADEAEAIRAATAEYQSLHGDRQRLQQRIDRYRQQVLDIASQRTAAATAAYASNQVGLIAVFEARHAEVQAQRKLLALQRDWSRVQAQLAYRPLRQVTAP